MGLSHYRRRTAERLCLESFQSGLSWRTTLAKRENLWAAFDGLSDIAERSRPSLTTSPRANWLRPQARCRRSSGGARQITATHCPKAGQPRQHPRGSPRSCANVAGNSLAPPRSMPSCRRWGMRRDNFTFIHREFAVYPHAEMRKVPLTSHERWMTMPHPRVPRDWPAYASRWRNTRS